MLLFHNDEEILDTQVKFFASLQWPEARQRIKRLFERGLQQHSDQELNLGTRISNILPIAVERIDAEYYKRKSLGVHWHRICHKSWILNMQHLKDFFFFLLSAIIKAISFVFVISMFLILGIWQFVVVNFRKQKRKRLPLQPTPQSAC